MPVNLQAPPPITKISTWVAHQWGERERERERGDLTTMFKGSLICLDDGSWEDSRLGQS